MGTFGYTLLTKAQMRTDIYVCPSCFKQLTTKASNSEITLFECESCDWAAPSINEIIYFTEARKRDEGRSKHFFGLVDKLSVDRSNYDNFLRLKRCRGTVDSYAAFRPFNESSRAFYPFIGMIKKNLKPGDVILNTWCRTGWSSFFLSGLFPEQRIITVWEGNKDVLGYAGFDYWLSKEKRPENLEIIFHDLNQPIPLLDDSVAFAFGLDTLHRYNQDVFVSEILRVAKDDGIIVFPHVHLSNSNPEPFFERGEKQIHGRDYEREFAKALENRKADAYVLSEPGMFNLDSKQELSSDPDTKDYNALIAIIPDHLTEPLKPFDCKSYSPNSLRVLLNPLLQIDLSSQKVTLDRDHLNGEVGKMLDRHQVYLNRLTKNLPFELTTLQAEILYLASQCHTVAEISENLGTNLEDIWAQLEKLSRNEIVHVLPLAERAVHLQQFHSGSLITVSNDMKTVTNLWRGTIERFSSDVMVINSDDGSVLTYNDANTIIELCRKKILALGVGKGGVVCICSKPHLEAVLTYLAVTSMGITACMINSELSKEQLSCVLDEQSPQLLFSDENTLATFPDKYRKISVVFDGPDANISNLVFSEWIRDISNRSNQRVPSVDPADISTILYTSGSTGFPKGVKLSHSALFDSARLLAETYQWNQHDRLLVTSEFDSMSGLRNACLSSIYCGAKIIVPKLNKGRNTLSIVYEIERHQITLLTATPALVKQITLLGAKIKSRLASLRQVICTGGSLTSTAIAEFEEIFGIRIINYYGLTETSGFCIGEPLPPRRDKSGSIGVPMGAICQIVDGDDKVLNANSVGRLRVYSNRHMSGYYGHGQQSLIASNGWLYTGDLAYRDDDGYFFLKGRERDIIKNESGQVVYLSELEDVLAEHEDLRDVVVCSYDTDGLEHLAVFVLPLRSAEVVDLDKRLKQYVRSRLGAGKVPRVVKIVDEFKWNERGQINKSELLQNLEIDET